MAVKVIVSGANGHMGRIVRETADQDPDIEIVGLVDAADGTDAVFRVSEVISDADVVIDFSHHDATGALLDDCMEKGLPIVLCTTGQTEEEMAAIDEAATKIAIFRSANMSLGVALTAKIVREVAQNFGGADVEVVEAHHNRKIDAPSGTALMLADAANVNGDANIVCGRAGQAKREKGEIGITSIRMGNVVGMHEVMFGTNNQTITIKHEAHDRALFADGAIDAAKFICNKAPGLYNMDDLLK